MSLFRKPAFDGASLAAFVQSAAMFAMFLYLTFYIQNQLGYGALAAGLRFLPATTLSFLAAPLSGKLAERFGARWFVGGGLLLIAVGLLLMGGRDPQDHWTALLPGFAATGIGVGICNPALANAAVSVVGPERAGMASGINSTFRQIGLATGVAAWGAVFAHIVNQHAAAFARAVGHGPPPGTTGSFSDFISFGAYRSLGPRAIQPGREAFLAGLNAILVIAAIVSFVGGIACLILIRPRDFVAHGEAAAAASGEREPAVAAD
jgi:MFS family permease